jgi:hypothetical protein
MMDEYVRLLSLQEQLETESDGRIKFFGQSVSNTIRTCLVNGMAKRADKLKSDFKVPDKRYAFLLYRACTIAPSSRTTVAAVRFWYLKLHALTKTRDFEGLEAFSRSKRSPIGYEAFVRHLTEKGHPKEAVQYVARCDAPRRIDLYIECGEWRMAAKECKERSDKARLE